MPCSVKDCNEYSVAYINLATLIIQGNDCMHRTVEERSTLSFSYLYRSILCVSVSDIRNVHRHITIEYPVCFGL